MLHPRETLISLAHRLAALTLTIAHRALVPALVLAALAALSAPTLAMLRGWHERRARRGARYVEVFAPPEADLPGATQLWSALHDALRPRWHARLVGRQHLAFELTWHQRGALRIGIWVPGTVAPGVVERAIEGAWPGTATRVLFAPPAPLASDDVHRQLAKGGELRLGLPEWFALNYEQRNDPLRAIIAAAGDLQQGETAAVQILARPVNANARRLRHAERAARELRTGKPRGLLRGLAFDLLDLLDLLTPGPVRGRTSTSTNSPSTARQDPTVGKDIAAILAKLTARPCWEFRIRYGVATPAYVSTRFPTVAGRRWLRATDAGPTTEDSIRTSTSKLTTGVGVWTASCAAWWRGRGRLRGRAHTLASAFGVYTGRNHLVRRRLPRPGTTLAARHFRRGDLLCLPELVALAHLPIDASIPGLARAGAKAVAPLPDVPTTGDPNVKLLGDSEAGGVRPVTIAVADARYHLHLMGATGAGKSNLLCNLVLDDVTAGRGAIVIDPKGDLVRDLLERLPARAAGHLVLLDPDERTAPPALNPLDGDDPDLATDHLVGIFRNIFTNVWGPRTDDILRAACLTLLQVPEAQATLADLPRLLTDPAYRERFTAQIPPHSPLHGFWVAYERTSGHAQVIMIGPLLARLRAFLMRPFVADVCGSATSSFQMREVLDGGLLLARVPKGQLGAETSRLLGSFIVAKVWQTALHRAEHREPARADATLYVDECHNYLTLPVGFEEMFAEARGYRLSLVLAHQHLGQLPRELREAISTNARNKLWFTMSPEDARDLERHVAPDLSAHDLAHLGGFQAACRLAINGRGLPAFTLRTRPAPPPIPGRAAQMRASARSTYGRPQATRSEQRTSREARTADAPGRRGFRASDLGHPQSSPSGGGRAKPPARPDRAPRLHHDHNAPADYPVDRWEGEEGEDR